MREENVLRNAGALLTYILPEANLARRRSVAATAASIAAATSVGVFMTSGYIQSSGV